MKRLRLNGKGLLPESQKVSFVLYLYSCRKCTITTEEDVRVFQCLGEMQAGAEQSSMHPGPLEKFCEWEVQGTFGAHRAGAVCAESHPQGYLQLPRNEVSSTSA